MDAAAAAAAAAAQLGDMRNSVIDYVKCYEVMIFNPTTTTLL